MKKTYTGSCHCGGVRYSCELDLAAGTTRCNCSFCKKARFWMAFVKEDELHILEGAHLLTDYQHTPAGMEAPFLHLTFCSRCGIRPFTRGGALPQFGGPFYAVNLATLDDATDDELANAKVAFADGRNGDWQATPSETRHL